jgi:hypothetical protein
MAILIYSPSTKDSLFLSVELQMIKSEWIKFADQETVVNGD